MKKTCAWIVLFLLIVLMAVAVVLFFRQDVTHAELKEDISGVKVEVLAKGDEILTKLKEMAARQQASAVTLDDLLSAQRQTLEKLDQTARKLDDGAAKLDRLLKYADRELPDGMKVAE